MYEIQKERGERESRQINVYCEGRRKLRQREQRAREKWYKDGKETQIEQGIGSQMGEKNHERDTWQ